MKIFFFIYALAFPAFTLASFRGESKPVDKDTSGDFPFSRKLQGTSDDTDCEILFFEILDECDECDCDLLEIFDRTCPDPTDEPRATSSPTVDPTSEPTNSPTSSPTVDPTSEPTNSPTSSPTVDPTGEPTKEPTSSPTVDPTGEPTQSPAGSSLPTFCPRVLPKSQCVSSRRLGRDDSDARDGYDYKDTPGCCCCVCLDSHPDPVDGRSLQDYSEFHSKGKAGKDKSRKKGKGGNPWVCEYPQEWDCSECASPDLCNQLQCGK